MPAASWLLSLYCVLFASVDGTPLVKEGGLVEYTLSFTNGVKDLPSSAQFSVTLTQGLSARIPTCTYNPGSGPLTISADTPITNSAELQKDLVWTCKFQVLVSNAHKLAGEVPAFDILFTFTNGGVTDAFYVPKATTTAVPVYTGGTLDYVSNVADTADTTKFVDGKQRPGIQICRLTPKPIGSLLYCISPQKTPAAPLL